MLHTLINEHTSTSEDIAKINIEQSKVQTEHTDDNVLVSNLTHLFALIQLKPPRNRNYLLIISNCAPIRCFYKIRQKLK